MYTFVIQHLCASIAHLEGEKARNQTLDYINMSPWEFITHMYNSSITTKAFKERKYILAQAQV